MRYSTLALGLFAGTIGFGAHAMAQDLPPPAKLPIPQESSTLPAQETPTLPARSSDGIFAPLGKTFSDYGIAFHSLLTNENATSLEGGVHRAGDDVGQFNVGMDFDLQKTLGIRGGSFHFTVYRDYGNSLALDQTGTFIKQQDIYKNAFAQVHLGLVAYEQKLLNNKLDIIVGHLGSTAYFGHISTGCYFQSGATCGVPAILNSEAGFSLLPSATLGANVKYKITPHIYVDTGAFEVNSFMQHTSGLVFAPDHATGFTVPIEFGYENTDLKKVPYPSELKVGYYASTSPRNDPYFNTKNQSLGLFGGTARVAQPMRQGAWIMGDKTVWRPDLNQLQNITVSAGYLQPFEKEEVMDREIFAGALWRAPLGFRRQDTIGFNMSWFHLSPEEVEFLRDARIKLKGHGVNDPNEFIAELNYGYQFNHATRITPNVQYIINPDNVSIPKINYVTKNVLVVGVKLVINVADLFGLPSQAIAD